ncbi:hypothetical protein [Pyxidicoccus sp. MSG2]|uniref:hypothetical protein n=1 Tax=Pyxidicoccus sp. MSG2 TaxID=2996790 RepID=UPI00226E007C|nr:hypothetical protein [Pyxidicoccus sp. MSG2]MCY1018471.1 hypothetical protein [Pyxidicoccus sp. MSG2]
MSHPPRLMTRSTPRLWNLAVVVAACGGLLGCDELEGLNRTVSVRAEVTDACIRQALEGIPGAVLSGESERWSVQLPGSSDGKQDLTVVLTRKTADTELTVFVQQIVSGRLRYTPSEIATADKATAEVMKALVSACLPAGKPLSASCEVRARVVPDGKCQHNNGP